VENAVEAIFTGIDDFAGREEDGFMGNLQYIADSRPIPSPEPAFRALKVWLLRQYLSTRSRLLWAMLLGRGLCCR
jgi:hypothetical protein